MVVSRILHSVEKDIAEALIYYDTAEEIWNDLKLRFGCPNNTRLYQIQKEIINVALGNLSISSYFTRFKKLWDEYVVLVEMPKCRACGVMNTMPQLLLDQQIIQFLVGLPDSYNNVCAGILMMRPTPCLGEVYRILLEDEQQRDLNNSPSINGETVAFNSFQRGNYNQNSNNQYNGGQQKQGATSS